MIYLEQYQPYPYILESVDLVFQLDMGITRVSGVLQLSPNSAYRGTCSDIVLNGEDIQLESIALDGNILTASDYQIRDELLTIPMTERKRVQVNIVTTCSPKNNLELSGLYVSSECLVTQCEAEGFRRITYYPDRTDVLSTFTVTLHADKKNFPVLLSNGDDIACGETEDGKHWVKWQDPHPKPCYLFALVAGDLDYIEKPYKTKSGRDVTLKIFANAANVESCHHAMQALIAAMKWDEKTYGCEYDLDTYMIVAVDDFNSGAMENKGLNIFNSKYILAEPDTATDLDYQNVTSVIGHEYFHNWSGNRVTCRDWFQLSLKEGFTIFREQDFAASVGDADLCRIGDVKRMRTEQFSQDASSMSHPVQPDAYEEIRNFYTVTIYEKGAEVIHMLKRLLGEEGFIKGAKAYFSKYDGMATTINEFVDTVASVNDYDYQQFFHWYKQAGTPEVTIKSSYNANKQQLTLNCTQQTRELPMVIPIALSVLDDSGELLEVTSDSALKSSTDTELVLPLTDTKQTFIINNVTPNAVPSLFRGFSAPVKYAYEYTKDELILLVKHETDAVARWDAMQLLILDYFNRQDDDITSLIDLVKTLLADFEKSPGLTAELITLPDERYLLEMCPSLTIDEIITKRDHLEQHLADTLKVKFLNCYRGNRVYGDYDPNKRDMAARSLRNACLLYLSRVDDNNAVDVVYSQFAHVFNMTERLAALKCLADLDHKLRDKALDAFYSEFQTKPLVLDMWYAVQAKSRLDNTIDHLTHLLQDESFKWTNPNRIYATIGAFSRQNLRQFHRKDGAGYQFLTRALLRIDQFNSEVAARMAEPFTRAQRLDPARQALMRAEVDKLLSTPELSSAVREILT